MNIETLHIGMKVRHPQYGVGVVRSLTEQIAEIAFDDAPRTIAPASTDLQLAEATAILSELEMPLVKSDPRYCSRSSRGTWAGTKGCSRRGFGHTMAAWNPGNAIGRQFASAERSPA
jgi:hypothetical protein